MSNYKYTTTLQIVIEHEKPLTDLTDKVAGRVYTIEGVSNTTATIVKFTKLDDPEDTFDIDDDDFEDSVDNV